MVVPMAGIDEQKEYEVRVEDICASRETTTVSLKIEALHLHPPPRGRRNRSRCDLYNIPMRKKSHVYSVPKIVLGKFELACNGIKSNTSIGSFVRSHRNDLGTLSRNKTCSYQEQRKRSWLTP